MVIPDNGYFTQKKHDPIWFFVRMIEICSKFYLMQIGLKLAHGVSAPPVRAFDG
jgi:hypothetical protein